MKQKQKKEMLYVCIWKFGSTNRRDIYHVIFCFALHVALAKFLDLNFTFFGFSFDLILHSWIFFYLFLWNFYDENRFVIFCFNKKNKILNTEQALSFFLSLHKSKTESLFLFWMDRYSIGLFNTYVYQQISNSKSHFFFFLFLSQGWNSSFLYCFLFCFLVEARNINVANVFIACVDMQFTAHKGKHIKIGCNSTHNLNINRYRNIFFLFIFFEWNVFESKWINMHT